VLKYFSEYKTAHQTTFNFSEST